jgi:hypothetical protein
VPGGGAKPSGACERRGFRNPTAEGFLRTLRRLQGHFLPAQTLPNQVMCQKSLDLIICVGITLKIYLLDLSEKDLTN